MSTHDILRSMRRVATELVWSVRAGRSFGWFVGDVEASVGTAILSVGIARSLQGLTLSLDSPGGLVAYAAYSSVLAAVLLILIRSKLVVGEGLWMHAPAANRQEVEFAAPALLVFIGIGSYAAFAGGQWGLSTACGSALAIVFALIWIRFGRPRHLLIAGAVQATLALFGMVDHPGAFEDALLVVASIVTVGGALTLARARAWGTRGPVLPSMVRALFSDDVPLIYAGLRAARTMVDADSIGRLIRLAYHAHPLISSHAVDVLWTLWGDSEFISMPRYIRYRAAGPWRIDPRGALDPESSAFDAYQNHLDRVEFTLRAAVEKEPDLADLIREHARDADTPCGNRRRLLSVRMLGALHDERAMNLLAQIACTDEDREARGIAAVSAQSARPEIGLALLGYLGERPVWVRRQAFRVLGSVASRYMDHDRSYFERLRIDCAPLVRAQLASGDPMIRAFAAGTAAQLDPEAEETLRLLSMDDSPFVRCHALHALSHLGVEGVYELLVRSLEDPRASVRRTAIGGLIHLGNKTGIPPLLRMHRDPVEAVAEFAAQAVSLLELYRDDG